MKVYIYSMILLNRYRGAGIWVPRSVPGDELMQYLFGQFVNSKNLKNIANLLLLFKYNYYM